MTLYDIVMSFGNTNGLVDHSFLRFLVYQLTYRAVETGLDHVTLQAPFHGTGSFGSGMLTVHHTVPKAFHGFHASGPPFFQMWHLQQANQAW